MQRAEFAVGIPPLGGKRGEALDLGLVHRGCFATHVNNTDLIVRRVPRPAQDFERAFGKISVTLKHLFLSGMPLGRNTDEKGLHHNSVCCRLRRPGGCSVERRASTDANAQDAVVVAREHDAAGQLQNVCRARRQASGGQLKIDALPAGQVVPAFEVLDATHKKVIDGAHSVTDYWIGKSKTATFLVHAGAGHSAWTPWIPRLDYEGGGLDLWWEFYRRS